MGKMMNIAIVGPEGSGKTVMLAGLGALYIRPDSEGYYLEPLDRTTYAYVSGLVHEMRNGHWPMATEVDERKPLTWKLCRRDGLSGGEALCKVSFFDFAGEIYRDAFGRAENISTSRTKTESKPRGKHAGDFQTPMNDCALLQRSVRKADVVFVLVNLSDVISGRGGIARATEIGWATKSILDYVYAHTSCQHRQSKAVLVLSQADAYQDIIKAEGGPCRVLEKYLPVIWSAYSDIEVITASSVGRTRLDDDGIAVPATDFSFDGLKVIVDVILRKIAAPGDDDSCKIATPEADNARKIDALENGDSTPLPTLWSAVCDILWGGFLLVAFLVFISWHHEFLSSSGLVLMGFLPIWIFSGLCLFLLGAWKLARISVSTLIAILLLILCFGGPFVTANRVKSGLIAFFDASSHVIGLHK